uniref:Uncharacterized protein n=1 Tax=Candidatus Kentrum sp. LPFa TaxID=2126335 RepID=A0A450W5B3_9GAMM|nr:MAG: hypothetical protein BECKLPF1236B_GA0070989_10323 [Candidatus Kentron sp. LPFa]
MRMKRKKTTNGNTKSNNKIRFELAVLLGILMLGSIAFFGNAAERPTPECGDEDAPACICAPEWPGNEIVCSPVVVSNGEPKSDD